MYFLKWILHDWPDRECQMILRSLKPAMRGYDSCLLICEAVLDDSRPSKMDAFRDINMLSICGKERSIEQWEQLLGGENFVIEKIHGLGKTKMSCIIEARLKED